MSTRALLTSYFNIAVQKKWGKNKKYLGYYFFFNSPTESEKEISATFLARISGENFIPVLVEYISSFLRAIKASPRSEFETISPAFISRMLKLIASYGLSKYADFVASGVRILQGAFRESIHFNTVLQGILEWVKAKKDMPQAMVAFLREQLPHSPVEIQLMIVRALLDSGNEAAVFSKEIINSLKEEAKSLILENYLLKNPSALAQKGSEFWKLPNDEKRVVLLSELKKGLHHLFRKHYREYLKETKEIEEFLYLLHPNANLLSFDDARAIFSETPLVGLGSAGKDLFLSILENALSKNGKVALSQLYSRFESSLTYNYITSILRSPEDTLFEKIKKIPFYLEGGKTVEQMITALRMGYNWKETFLQQIRQKLKQIPFEIASQELSESITLFINELSANITRRELLISKLANADLETVEIPLKLTLLLHLHDRLNIKPTIKRLKEATRIGKVLNFPELVKISEILTAKFYPEEFMREMPSVYKEDPILYASSIVKVNEEKILHKHLDILWSALNSPRVDERVLEQLSDATVFLLNKFSPPSYETYKILEKFYELPVLPERLRNEFLKHIVSASPVDEILEIESKIDNENKIKAFLSGLRTKFVNSNLSPADSNYLMNKLIFGKYLSHSSPDIRAEAFSIALLSNEQRLFPWLSQQIENENNPQVIKKYLWFLKSSSLYWKSQRGPAFVIKALSCDDEETRELAEKMTIEHVYSDSEDYASFLESYISEETKLNLHEAKTVGERIENAISSAPADKLAEPLFTQKERFLKQITYVKELSVMFVDMKGFTSRTAGMSPVEVKELLELYESLTIPHIENNGGKVIKKIGDGIMAVFEEPLQALDAAHDILSALFSFNLMRIPENQIHVRIGLNHGKVFVEENDVFGDTVNLASRMESAAQPDTCYMTLPLYNAGKDKYELIPVGYLKVKGFKEEVLAYMMVVSSGEHHKETFEKAKKLERIYRKFEKFQEELSKALKETGVPEDKVKRFEELWNDFLGKFQKEILN